MYFFLSAVSYFFIFDHRLKKHPKYLKNQVKMEILCALKAIGPIDILVLPIHLAQVRGHSKLYTHVSDIKGVSCFTLIKPMLDYLNLTEKFQDQIGAALPTRLLSQYPLVDDTVKQLAVALRRTLYYDFGGGWSYLIFSYFLFLIFTDFTVYLIHRIEHHPFIYKHIHKTHHKWVIPTPFASYAFHPLDGFLQSVPHHIFVFIFPFHRFLYLFAFLFVIVWTILIHDSELIVGHRLENHINGPTHHTLHHMYFNCNYGQYFTWTDKLFSTYRNPDMDAKSTLDSAKQKSITPKACQN
ncbi:hypothetical protein PtA15_16A275 [Puccinia triticina]|nr:uncharacterized protein PtA15_16A275 [Puccinia triticina]WAQ92368.1 hypothetical protein PtA15_16A275 [Puccinia triticina]